MNSNPADQTRGAKIGAAASAAENGVGYVAGQTGTFKSTGTGGSRYQALGSGKSSSLEDGRAPEPFEVELLSDVEGKSERPTRDPLDEPVCPDNDRWMRNIWALPNRAVVMSYFCVGFAIRFITVPQSYYVVHVLGAHPAQQNVLLTLASLPWSFKLVYGFISDNFPLGGMRRKPYFIMGWGIYVLVNFYVSTWAVPTIQLLAVGTLVSSMGFMLSDVTTDAILVERSKHEPRETRGSMQAVGYSVRFAGSLVGSVLGMVLYNKENWGWGLSIQQLFFLNGVFPLACMAPWVWHLRETAVIVPDNVPMIERLRTQCGEVFSALEQRAVYGPLAFIFLYNMFQVPNAAWKSFLVDGLNFQSYELGILGVVGSVVASLGLLAYKRWFFNSSWRDVYVWTTLVVAFFSLAQILLILRVNLWFGVKDLAFAIGDDSIADFVLSIQFMPVIRMYISMCPDGAEGTTYAILTTMSNVAMAAASNIGTMFTVIWDVDNDTFRRGDFTGMWKLTLLTSIIQPLPLILVRWLPASQAEQRVLQASNIRDWCGGVLLLVVLFASLLWTVALSIFELTGE